MAQTTITGVVLEEYSNEPIPFAHVFFQNTQNGTTSGIDGTFSFNLRNNEFPSDTLIFKSLGYQTLKVAAKGKTEFEIHLTSDNVMMQELVIKAGENPAIGIMEKVVANKKANNPFSHPSIQYQEYSKIRFDLNNFTENIKKNYLLKPFDYIWKNTDTTADGIPYLPVLLVEKTFEHYQQQKPEQQKSILKAKKVTGLPGPKIMEFVEDLYFTPNVYEDYVVILDKNFPSPLNNNFKLHYRYYLDSSGTGADKTYNLIFKPKRSRELAFTGEMKVNAQSFALTHISLRFDIMANVNFVRSYLVEQEYTQEGTQWLLTQSNVLGDFTVVENSSDLTGFFGRKKSTFSQYKLNEAIPNDIWNGSALLQDETNNNTEHNWETIRPENLDEQEEGIKVMMNQLEQDPKFIFRKNLLVGIATGYIPFKKIDIGNFYTFYSHNYIEDSRVKLGFRTQSFFNKKVEGSLYGAYGSKDEQFKYGLKTRFQTSKEPNTFMGLELKDDIEQLGRSHNIIDIDHLFTSFIQIGDATSRIYTQRFTAYLEQRINANLTSRIAYEQEALQPTANTQFYAQEKAPYFTSVSQYKNANASIILKYSWQNKTQRGDFYDKESLKKEFRKYPDLKLKYTNSQKAFGSDFNFQSIKLGMNQHLRMRNWGYALYRLEAGKTFGAVPYPFLNTPLANQLVLYDDMAFNLMHYLEFLADEYITANIQHHFDGAILDKVPLLNQLKWRSFVFAKGYWGSLSEENQQEKYLFPQGANAIIQPYYEVGFGIENIFKIARMDFVWRLNDTTLPDSYRFIVKPSFSFSF